MNDYPEAYPVRVEADYPEQSSRLLALCGILFMWPKAILLVPHIFVLYFVQLAAFLVAYLGFWVVLFTGRYPRGMHGFVVGVMRWQTRLTAWLLGIVDRYPPFSTQ
ncbi:MAG: DUF4389 domain-containing protein [Planctomycetes bacterium]|nr:DUF4389 domain-containing protein [Planctomycetota bacterium]